MTRINVGVHPSELNTKMLIAEHREIKRIPNCIKKGRYCLKDIPSTFKLGTGHVKFFYNKVLFLKKRYVEIRQECLRRNYNVQDFSDCFEGIPKELLNDYVPTERDRLLILERISERLNHN